MIVVGGETEIIPENTKLVIKREFGKRIMRAGNENYLS